MSHAPDCDELNNNGGDRQAAVAVSGDAGYDKDNMIPMVRALFAHMAWADGVILRGCLECETARDDEQLRKWLHHIVSVQRFFLGLFQERPFDVEREMRVPDNLNEIQTLFEEAHSDGQAYVARLQEAELDRRVNLPRMDTFHPQIRDVLMQVIMHGEHHRAQCAARLRTLGGTPQMTDYILWVRDVTQPTPAAGA